MTSELGNKNKKLELTWIGKDARPKLEPRILLEDPDKSYHARHRSRAVRRLLPISADSKRNNLREFTQSASEIGDLFDNRLIFGDNLLALKALEQEFAGKVQFVFTAPECL